MFFISSGECTVNIVDDKRNEIIAHRLLVEGNHFGEIGLIYDCIRTASVQSRNYNTMATLSKQNFLDLMNEIPGFLKNMKRHVYRYEDPLKTYTSEMMIKLPYFSKNFMHKHIFHRILYSF